METQPRTFKFSWSAALTIALAVILLFLAFRGVDWGEMLRTVQQGRMEYMLLVFCMMTVSYFLRSLRWRVLLTAEKPIHPLTTFWATNIGYLGNYFLPARAGELIRSVLIAQRTGINFMFVVATILTERIVDAALLVLFIVTLLPMLGTPPEWLISARQVMLIVGFGGLIGLLLAPRLEGLALAILARLPLPETLKAKLQSFLEKFLLGVRAFQNVRRGATFLLLTAAIWSLDVVIGIVVATAFGLELGAAEVLFLLAALGLSSAVPSTPGYLGVYQFVAVSVLAPFGIGQSEALVYILAFQGMTYLLVIVWGIIGLWRLNANLLEIRQTAKQVDAPASS